MSVTLHNPDGLFPPYRNYSHAAQVKGDASIQSCAAAYGDLLPVAGEKMEIGN
jgi:hypothetical protein